MAARIVIRADGSHKVGMGHVYRMVNLAEALREVGMGHIVFCSRVDEQVGDWLQNKDFQVEIFAGDGEDMTGFAPWLAASGANLLIHDVLDTEADYMSAIRHGGCKTINFDDNGPGRHLADCRINALPSKMLSLEDDSSSYQGPDYLLLGEEFLLSAPVRPINEHPTSILVTLGGSDTYGNTISAVTALRRIDQLQRVDIITGPAFRHRDALVLALEGDGRFVVHASVPSMAEFMLEHDLAIIGGGITLFEAARCALPTLAIASEDFESVNIRWAEERAITRFAGEGQPIAADAIYAAARSLLADENARRAMSKSGPLVVDGRGRQRVVNIIRELCN